MFRVIFMFGVIFGLHVNMCHSYFVLSPQNNSLSLLPTESTKSGFNVYSNNPLVNGFISAFTMIMFSEVLDKTFFIAAVLAMKHSRLIVFSGAISALALMTVLSVFFGWIAQIIPQMYVHYISALLFALFGLKMLKDGYEMDSSDSQGEFDSVESDIRKQEEELEKDSQASQTSSRTSYDQERGCCNFNIQKRIYKWMPSCISRVLIQSFTMTFMAEWGDRSQVATVILAARENVYSVTIGAIIGHSLCTGGAVLAGRLLSRKVSLKAVTILGGIVFLIVAVIAVIRPPPDN